MREPNNPTTGRTLGPVSDLERHLPSDWWQTLFNSLYLKTDGDVVENAANTKIDIDLLLKTAGLELNDHVLDLCCGQGRHTLELARRGFRHVTGVDRSRYLVRLARTRARKEGLNAAFREGDARTVRLKPASFHCVIMMGNSFGYFDREEDDAAVLETAKKALVSRGTLVMDIADGEWMKDRFERRSWEWIDENHFVCRERNLARDGRRLISREVVVHAERGVLADQFYSERLYTRKEIQDLMESVGFTQVRFHAEVQSDSSRNQDLGMMAHRLFLTSEAPPKSTVTRKREVPFPEVTVLMGDPRLPDSVKLGGQFNPEDLDTIERLKEALAEMEGVSFKYLDNHQSLWTELRTNQPSFVLNLCDEGFNNDAFLELHVPAMLEILGVPYSGAAPAALGLCYDKALVRAVAQSLDVPVPSETFFDPTDQAATLPGIFPAMIKPNFGDSSIGITKNAVVRTPEEAINYINELRELLPNRPLLVQEYLDGAEYSVGVIGNPGFDFHVMPVLEVDYSGLDADLPKILGYESKWDPSSAYWTQIKYKEADLPEEERRLLADNSRALFDRLGCRDYARFDFRADSAGRIKLLEVNPNPGWSWDAKMNIMAGFEGLRYSDLLRMIVEAAQARVAAQRGLVAAT
ncbi:MAG: methyltransferase domain-containing protein [Alphaproteobacteria bacterium]